LPKIKAATDETVAKLDADMAKQAIETEKANKLIPEYQAKIATINTALVALRADTANLTKNKATIDKYAAAVRSYEAAIRAYSTVGKQSERSERAKAQAVDQYENSKTDIETTLGMAKLICSKGF
jgi:septal ring factor EnvC (AmiA/AmiB activator)